MEYLAAIARILAIALAGTSIGCALGGANWLLWGITGFSVGCAVAQVITVASMCLGQRRLAR
jgi:hypothetical protein